MRKVFAFLTAGVILCGCSNNEMLSDVESAKTPVVINVYSQGQTRATETSITTLQTNGFKFVAMNGSTKMIDSNVTYSGGVWNYGSETVYWPSDASSSIKFYGLYSPTSTDAIDAANDKATLTVDGKGDVVASYSSKALSDYTAGASDYGTVTLSFGHVMAEVVVSAKGDNTSFDYSISKITYKTAQTVDYTFSSKATAANSGTVTLDYVTSSTAVSNSSFTALADANMLIVPALSSTLEVTYTVTKGADAATYTKSATITPVAGKVNRINLTLPSSRTAMTITVGMDNWITTENTLTPSLN